MQEEERLVRRAQQQDEAALAQIYETYFNRLYRYVVVRVGNRAEAEDVTQQVFLKVLQSLPSYKFKGVPFSSWLFRIAHNLVVDYHRRNKKAVAAAFEMAVLLGKEEDPAQIAEQTLMMREVNEALPQLTMLQQEVVSLRFTAELSTAEAAQVLGKSEGAIKALQHSALVSLRQILVEKSKENERETSRHPGRVPETHPGPGREPGTVPEELP